MAPIRLGAFTRDTRLHPNKSRARGVFFEGAHLGAGGGSAARRTGTSFFQSGRGCPRAPKSRLPVSSAQLQRFPTAAQVAIVCDVPSWAEPSLLPPRDLIRVQRGELFDTRRRSFLNQSRTHTLGERVSLAKLVARRGSDRQHGKKVNHGQRGEVHSVRRRSLLSRTPRDEAPRRSRCTPRGCHPPARPALALSRIRRAGEAASSAIRPK